MQAGAFEAIGPRDSMEDRHLLLPSLVLDSSFDGSSGGSTTSGTAGAGAGAAAEPAEPLQLLAVFDGHRGSQAADFCRMRLPSLLLELAPASPSAAALLRQAFLQLDAGRCDSVFGRSGWPCLVPQGCLRRAGGALGMPLVTVSMFAVPSGMWTCKSWGHCQ